MTVWAGWPKVRALLKTAGAGLATPITHVDRGLPMSVKTRQIRFWYDGSGDSPFGDNTLTQTQEGFRLVVTVFLPMSGGSTEAEGRLDEDLEEAEYAIRQALMGDAGLGTFPATNTAIGVEVGNSTGGVETWAGALVRTIDIPVNYGLADRHQIAL